MKHTNDSNRVAIVYIEKDGKVLVGKRNDTKKFTVPGGHIENGESPILGAIRELKEETGLVPNSLALKVIHFERSKNLMLYLFEAQCDDYTCDSSDDPDQECPSWHFMDLADIANEMNVPLSHNLAIAYFMQK